MKKVLILGVAAVQYDSIKTLNEMGYETYAIAQNPDGPGAKEAKHFEAINFAEVDKVIEYIKENGIELVYSTGSDFAMPIATRISEELGLPKFICSDAATICNNKDMLRGTLGQDFEGNIPFAILTEKTEEVTLPYPFIMKPTDSQGQRGVNIINNHDEFLELFDQTKAYSRSGQVIIEKYVNGPEVSVNGYLVDGKMKFLEVSDRITWEKYVGLIHKHIIPTKSLSKKGLEKMSEILENACVKIGINNGPVYAQVKVEDDFPYIIEITPRLDGCHMWKLIYTASGFNLMKLTYEHLLENNTSELEKIRELEETFVLEFICQEPNTAANYFEFEKEKEESIEYYQYYNQGDNIRPVNGKYDKIGYFIYKDLG